MASAGTGIFFDGATSARRPVLVELSPEGLIVRDAEERAILARWPYDELDHLAAPHGMLRVGRIGAPRLARLEVRDPALIAAIDDASVPVDRSGAAERRSRTKVVVWSLVATVSLLLAAVYGVPALADKIAPLIPLRAERWLGEAVDTQARRMLDKSDASRPFECGNEDGRAALAKVMGKLEGAAALPISLEAKVVRRSEPNAIALPGGHIYVFEGLVEKSESPDELAGVIAHEIGHVAHRDGTRSILQSAGLSFLFGMLLGDFVGGGAVVIGARAVLQSSYSRDVESAADRYGVELMSRAGGDPRALGAILNRIAGTTHPGVEILRDHPDTKARVAVINSLAPAAQAARPLLDGDEWRALKRICTVR
ncbi:MAG: M48 family metallopeptidase [Xanthobacteraceae bacterium]